MRRKANLIAGAVCGALCVSSVLAYGAEVQSSFEKERAEVLERYGGEQVEVCVATKDIEVGDVLGSANTEKRLWLGELLPEDAVFRIEDMQGKPVSSPIYQGEVITERRFEESEHVALQVPDGLCAVSVPAKSVSAVGGSIEAGSYVDCIGCSCPIYKLDGRAGEIGRGYRMGDACRRTRPRQRSHYRGTEKRAVLRASG